MAAALILAGALAACGATPASAPDGHSGPLDASSTATPVARTPEQIIAAARVADAAVDSGRFTTAVSLTIAGDGAGLGIPQVRQLIGKPIAARVEASIAAQPFALDGTATVTLAGQSVTLSARAVGTSAWLEYAGTWYRLPSGPTKEFLATLGDSPGLTDATRQLVGLGLDPSAWDPTSTLVGIETRDGVDVYHVTTTVDARAALTDIDAALSGPSFWSAAGLPPAEAENARELAGRLLQMAGPTVTRFEKETWIGVDDARTRATTVALTMVFGGQAGSAGLDGLEFMLEFDAAHVGEPVTVTPPAGARPFARLQKLLRGASDGLLGGL